MELHGVFFRWTSVGLNQAPSSSSETSGGLCTTVYENLSSVLYSHFHFFTFLKSREKWPWHSPRKDNFHVPIPTNLLTSGWRGGTGAQGSLYPSESCTVSNPEIGLRSCVKRAATKLVFLTPPSVEMFRKDHVSMLLTRTLEQPESGQSLNNPRSPKKPDSACWDRTLCEFQLIPVICLAMPDRFSKLICSVF